MSVPVVENFLADALAGSNKLVPKTPPRLGIVTADGEIPTVASEPPLRPFTSPFVRQSVEEVSRQLGGATYFAVLDEQSTEDKTAVLGRRNPDGSVETVRVAFDAAQSLLTSLDVGTLGFYEIQHIAASSGGVYRPKYEASKKGGPAPRKKLGGD